MVIAGGDFAGKELGMVGGGGFNGAGDGDRRRENNSSVRAKSVTELQRSRRW